MLSAPTIFIGLCFLCLLYDDLHQPIMTEASKVDTGKITFDRNLATFKDNNVSLLGVRYDGKPLILSITGMIFGNAMRGADEYGGKWGFQFQPTHSEGNPLIGLEQTILNCDLLAVKEKIAKYTRKDWLNSDLKTNIKMPVNKDGKFKFESNRVLTIDNVTEEITEQTIVTLAGTIGFYFSDDKETYGMYFTLKNLKFEKTKRAPVKHAPSTAEVGVQA